MTLFNSASRRAFTLVELLVVIGIIALLISILLPTLNRARGSATSIKCASNLRSVGQGLAIYANTYGGQLPFGYWDGTAPGTGGYNADAASDWTLLVNGELDDSDGSTVATATRTGNMREFFRCPVAPVEATDVIAPTYSAHPRLMPDLDMRDAYAEQSAAGPKYLKPYKLAQIKEPTEKANVFCASIQPDGGGTGRYAASPHAYRLDASRISPGYPVGITTWLTDNYNVATVTYLRPDANLDISAANPASLNTDTPENWGNIRYRHGDDDKTNVLFVDGHTSSFTFKDATEGQLKRNNVNVSAN